MTAIGIYGSEGRMGKAIAAACAEMGVDLGLTLAGGIDQGGDPAALAGKADTLVDFSSPDALEAHLDACIAADKPIVVGTTGLEERHHFLIDSAAGEIAVLQTGNTSLGVNMLAALVKQAAQRLDEGWDIEIAEMHHRMKVDAPSGTALLLGEAAAKGRGIDLSVASERGRTNGKANSQGGITGERRRGAIGFASLRGGSVAGDHSVLFAGEQEVLTLSHRAEDRSIFARGAIRAGVWLVGKAPGRYTMADVLDI